MKIRRPPDKVELVGQRLTAARQALGLSQVELCDEFNVGTTTWNNWERGKLPDVLVMAKLSASRNITLDWIYNGDLSAIQFVLANKIQSQMYFLQSGPAVVRLKDEIDT